MVISKSPIFCEPPFPIGQVSSTKPLPSIHRQVSNIAAILGRCRLASASRSPRWSVWAWVRKIASSRSMLFSSSGHHGFVITQGSISATCPDDVVRENVLWPKYVIRFPLVLSTLNLQRKPDPRAPTGISCNGAAPFLGCGAHPSGTTRLWSAASLARLRSGPAASFCPNLSYILPAE